MQILMYINVSHDTSAEWVVFQIIDHPVHLIHHAFFILMPDAHLIAVCFPDRSILISPLIPHMAVKIMDIV